MTGPLIKREVDAWLVAQPKGAVVGKAGSLTCCPLAQHLRALDCAHVSIAPSEYSANCVVYRTPGWAENFIWKIDVLGKNHPVTREEALAALRRRAA